MSRKVLGMVLKGYPRISETFIANEILLLESLGFEIHILSMRQPRESFQHECVKRIKAKVDYLPENIQGHALELISANLAWAARHPWGYLKGLGHMTRRWFKTRRPATLKHLLQAGYLAARILPGSDINHLHAHFSHSPTSVAWYASILTGLPFSFTAHAKDIYTQNPASLAHKLAEAAFAVTCTGYNLNYLSDLNTIGTPLYKVYHGIDLSLFTPGPWRLEPMAPYEILTVARLTPKKGLVTVLKALAILHEKGLDFRYVLVGEGEQERELKSLASQLGLDGRIKWLGTKPHGAVIECFKRADMFILGCEVSGNGDRDGIPNVLAESMAMGVPVLATTVSAIPELIEDGQHGLLVPPGDPLALALAAARLLTDHQLRQKLIPQARQRVEAMFDNRCLALDLAAIMRTHLP